MVPHIADPQSRTVSRKALLLNQTPLSPNWWGHSWIQASVIRQTVNYSAHGCLKVATSWDFDDYTQACHKQNIFSGLQQKERNLLKKFPWITKDEIRSITTPRTITDCNGKILLWVLPQLLSPRLQVRIFYCQVSVIEHSVANYLRMYVHCT